jgi:hypothetical protein
MNKEWRPDDWVNPYGNYFTEQIKAFESGASNMISARDKWWIEWFESNCTGDIYGGMTILHKDWQSLKQSLEVK